MMKILLIGGGTASARYVESLIWTPHLLAIAGFGKYSKSEKLSALYDLPYYVFYKMTEKELASYDLLIVCVPVQEKCHVINWLVYEMKYSGRVILEKPFVIGTDNINILLKAIKRFELCIVACQRDFDLGNYRLVQSNEYRIIWQSISASLEENIVHMLPHLLSWLIIELDSTDIDLHICGSDVTGTIGGKVVEIRFASGDDNYVEINEIRYASPNYRRINAHIVNEIFEMSKEEAKKNITRAVLVSKIVSALVEERRDQI